MEKVLIIQTDSDYFLFETIHTLNKYQDKISNWSIDLLIDGSSIERFGFEKLNFNIVSLKQALASQYEYSFNLSINEEATSIQQRIDAKIKNNDLWTTYLLTLRDQQPFLTFQLVDIYKNILNIKSVEANSLFEGNINKIIYSFSDPDVFSADEQESFINELARQYNGVPIFDISEIQDSNGFQNSIYIGPPHINALIGCTHFGIAIYLSPRFQGFNLVPSGNHHLVISGNGQKFKHQELLNIVHKHIDGEEFIQSAYALYKPTYEHLYGGFLNGLNTTDESYPIYCSYTVLWNFLINLIDTPLDFFNINAKQKLLLQNQSVILDKICNLYEYLIDSTQTALKTKMEEDKLNALEKIQEIREITEQIAHSNSLLRPLLKFYALRRSQLNYSNTITEDLALLVTEEHQSLRALQELFNSTLSSNKVNI